MGWMSRDASECIRKANGEVDKKAEMDRRINEDKGSLKVLKSAMIGNTYFAAVKMLKKENHEGIYKDIPEAEQKVYLLIYLITVEDGVWSEKPVDDYRCPRSIIALTNTLIPETLKNYEEFQAEEKRKKQLARLPYDTLIEVKLGFDCVGRRGTDPQGTVVILQKKLIGFTRTGRKRIGWMNKEHCYYIKTSDLPETYKIL